MKSLSQVWNKLGLFMLCILIDILFFFALGFFTAPVSARIGLLLVDFTAVLSLGLKDVGRSNVFASLLFSADLLPLWKALAGYALLFILAVFLVYIIFQSFAWFISLNIAGKKVAAWFFFRRFFLLSLLWFLLFIAYGLIDLVSDLSAVLGIRGVGFVSVIGSIFLLALAYFAVISYAVLEFRPALVIGWKEYKSVLPSFLAVFLFFFALNALLPYVFSLNYYLGAVLGTVVFLPALVLARVFMILSVERVK